MKPGAVRYLASDVISSRLLLQLKVKELERDFIYLYICFRITENMLL